MTEADVQDPFEAWLGSYGHRPHDLMHTFTRIDMRCAFNAGMISAAEAIGAKLNERIGQAAEIGTGPGATSHAPGPEVELSNTEG